jgi:hypothetical protein
MVAMATFDQDSYAFYSDGSESASGQLGSTNTETILNVDTNLQARLLVQESGGAGGDLSSIDWEYNHAGGGWNPITTSSSVVKAVDSSNLTNSEDTTQRIGAGSFVTPNGAVTEVGNDTANVTYASGEECEFLLSFQIVGADVTHGDEILLRIAGCDTFTRDADIDVNKPAGTRRVMVVS